MTILAAQRPRWSGWRTWLGNNRLAIAWLVAAAIISVVPAKTIPEGYRRSVTLADLPEGDRE